MHDDRYFLAAIGFCSQRNNTITSREKQTDRREIPAEDAGLT
jgi:hypothetical protein